MSDLLPTHIYSKPAFDGVSPDDEALMAIHKYISAYCDKHHNFAFDPANPQLAEALAECERLQAENQRLRERLGISQAEITDPLTPAQAVSTTQAEVTARSSPDEKVKLFRRLFSGRDDVYAVRWEGRGPAG